MKDMNDEEMQEMIDKGLSGLNESGLYTGDKDLRSYSLLFDALGQEPAIPLRYNFAAKVTEKIQAKKTRVSELKLYVLLGFGFLVLMAAALAYLSSVEGSPAPQFVQLLVRYKWIMAFGIAMLLIVQFLDSRFIKKSRSHHSA